MSRYDLVLDFETMGQYSVTCPIVDCSVIVFDWDRFCDNPYTFEELLDSVTHFKVSVADQVKNYGYVVEKGTIQFWESLPSNVLSKIKPKKSDLKLEDFAKQFLSFISKSPKISYWWSRSNTFDPVILERVMVDTSNQHLYKEYLKYWKVRDTRTFIDAKFNFTSKNGFIPLSDENWWKQNFEEHNSQHDVVADVLRLQAIHRAENGKDMT